jgi:hypothetical protein
VKKILFSALAGLVLVSACKKDDEAVPTMQVSGTLSPTNEVPAVTSSAKGTFMGTYAPSTNVLNYTVTFSGLTGAATAAHLHFGDAKHSGPVTVPFSPASLPTTTSGTFSGTATLNAMQADSLKAGRIYANIHTDANKGGELRANLTAK